MGYNRFAIVLMIRISVILFNLWGLSYLLGRQDLSYTFIFLLVLLIFQVFYLFQFVNQTNKELTKFIDALRNSDYTTNFPRPQNRSFELLFERFKNTLEHYQNKETKYEAQFQFIQYVVNNIETGILALNDKQKVVLINSKAEDVRRNYFFDGNVKLINALLEIEETGVIKSTNPDSPLVELVVFRQEIKLLEQAHTVFTFKDIKSHLATKEIESWQKLIRILAHEIINTLTPITSLAETSLLLIDKDGQEKSDIKLSLDTIKSRSEGLLTFMEDYRKLVKIPQPKKEHINLQLFVDHVLVLFKKELEHITVKTDIKHLEIFADKVLLEQMTINLITNAIQAFNKQKKELVISSTASDEYIELAIKDNGQGMDQESLDNAVVPFFTTKDQGSGIGLSLVQQLMHAHQGSVVIESELDRFTVIRLRFPINSS